MAAGVVVAQHRTLSAAARAQVQRLTLTQAPALPHHW